MLRKVCCFQHTYLKTVASGSEHRAKPGFTLQARRVPCTGGAINLKGFIPKGGLLQFVSSAVSGAHIGTFLRNLKISDRNGSRVAQL